MRLLIFALVLAISYAQTGSCQDNSPISGSENWWRCSHSNTYTCNNGRACCCEDEFEPNSSGDCVACTFSASPTRAFQHHSDNWLERDALLDSKISVPMAMIVYERRWSEMSDNYNRHIQELENEGCTFDNTNIGGKFNDRKPNEYDEFVMIYEVTCSGRKEMVIAYPGTETLNDFWTDISSAISKTVLFDVLKYDVTKGFYDHYDTIQNSESLDNSFDGTWKEFIRQRFEEIKPDLIRCVGHSLGAALAILQAVDLQEQRGNWLDNTPIALSTFGAPRVLKAASTDRAQMAFGDGNAFGNYAYRYVNYGDPIPSTPGSSVGFKHFGTVFYINYQYRLMSWGWSFTRQLQDFTPYNHPGVYDHHFRATYEARLKSVRDANLVERSSSSLSYMMGSQASNTYIMKFLAIIGVISCAHVLYQHFANSEKDYPEVLA